uniref:Uncharacterized protein n=1 Tax=Rhizophagus irregularis (strain DAOM 181602 / DAOM 197198 / MUCL 43194) TaxID=747089 RepID=U9T795_RHIID
MPRRIKACIDANGGHIKYYIFWSVRLSSYAVQHLNQPKLQILTKMVGPFGVRLQ